MYSQKLKAKERAVRGRIGIYQRNYNAEKQRPNCLFLEFYWFAK